MLVLACSITTQEQVNSLENKNLLYLQSTTICDSPWAFIGSLDVCEIFVSGSSLSVDTHRGHDAQFESQPGLMGHIALPEDGNSVSSPHIRWFTAAWNSSSESFAALFWTLSVPALDRHIHTYRHIPRYIIKYKSFEKSKLLLLRHLDITFHDLPQFIVSFNFLIN